MSDGTFVWYDLMTSDVQGAIRFYGDVIGWGTERFDGGEMPYVMWTSPSGPLGGVMDLPDDARAAGAPSQWYAYVATRDVDALTGRAISLGAKSCVPPQDIPTVGRFSMIADPQGAVIALFQGSGPDMPLPEPPATGRVSWHELAAADGASAFDFYAALFGWEKTEAMDMGEMGTYQMLGKGGRTFGAMMTKPAGDPRPPHWLYYVRVDDLDGSLERVHRGGGQVVNGPMEIPGGERVAHCVDPQGGAFALHGA